MDINNAQETICTSCLFPATAIMKGNSYAASAAVSGAIPRVIIVIQFAKEITNTFT